MKKIIILLLIASTIINCSADDNFTDDSIVGEWKLIEAKYYGFQGSSTSMFSISYLFDHITYKFNTDGTLIVSGDDNIGYSNGEYNYVFEEGFLGHDDNGPQVQLVKVNGLKWAHGFENGKMLLSRLYIDEPILVFIKK